MGGATPTMVPFSLLGGPELAPAGRGAPGGRGGAPAAGVGDVPGTCAWFIMSIVPLNFGAAALFR
jgi:hypothetical protein